MRRVLPALCALAMLLALCACGAPVEEDTPSPTPPETPTAAPSPYVEPEGFALGYCSASSLHPMQASGQGCLDADSLVYQGLYQLDARFEPQPVLAESAWASADALTWTVKVRGGVFFSNGETLTAQHVASSLLSAKQSARYASRLAAVAAVTAGEGTVVLTLSQPNGALPALLDIPIFLEREGALPLGTGPYSFAQGEDGVALRANPAWWQGRTPPYEIIELHAYGSMEERAAAFGSGEVTAVTCDFNAAGALGYSGTFETHDYSTAVMLYVGFNAGEGRACADARVRAALSRTLDRSSMVGSLLAGHGAAAALPISPASPLYSENAAARLGYDMQAAAALLEEAGWTKNEEGMLVQRRRSLELTLCVNRDSTVKRSMAVEISQALEELGIAVTVAALDWEAYIQALSKGEFDLYLGEVRLGPDFDFAPLLAGGSLGYGALAAGALIPALDNFRAASGTARRTAAETLYSTFADEAPFAPLCFKNYSLLARWGVVQNLAPLQDAPFSGIELWRT